MAKAETLVASLLAAACAASAAPLKWTCSWPEAASQTFTLYHGEEAVFQPSFRINGAAATNLAIEAVWYQTNGMGSAWWRLDGATFAPSNDCGAAAYRFFVEARDGSSAKIYRANGSLRMLDSPGFAPSAVQLPVRTLDFSQVEVLSPPWPDAAAIVAATNALVDALQAWSYEGGIKVAEAEQADEAQSTGWAREAEAAFSLVDFRDGDRVETRAAGAIFAQLDAAEETNATQSAEIAAIQSAITTAVNFAISPSYPAFSNAVLSVGIGIDTNAVATLNSLADSIGGIPGGATTVGGLLVALVAAVTALKRKKADKEDLPYALVEVAAGTVAATDRAMNHVTEARNGDGIWTADGAALPVGEVYLDDNEYVAMTKYGIAAADVDYSTQTSLVDIPDGTPFLVRGVCTIPDQFGDTNASASFTVTSVYDKYACIKWTGVVAWPDGTNNYSVNVWGPEAGCFGLTTDDYENPPAVQLYSYSLNGVDDMPSVGDTYTAADFDSITYNDEDISQYNPVLTMTSVSLTGWECSVVGTLSATLPNGTSVTVANVDIGFGSSYMGWYAGSGYSDVDAGIPIYSDLSFTDWTFSWAPVDEFPVVGEQLDTTGYLEFATLLTKSSGIALNPPAAVSGKVRDFAVAADATTDGLALQLTGVKGVDDDTFTLEAGRNLIYVTEPVAGELYASRRLIEEAAS